MTDYNGSKKDEPPLEQQQTAQSLAEVNYAGEGMRREGKQEGEERQSQLNILATFLKGEMMTGGQCRAAGITPWFWPLCIFPTST